MSHVYYIGALWHGARSPKIPQVGIIVTQSTITPTTKAEVRNYKMQDTDTQHGKCEVPTTGRTVLPLPLCGWQHMEQIKYTNRCAFLDDKSVTTRVTSIKRSTSSTAGEHYAN